VNDVPDAVNDSIEAPESGSHTFDPRVNDSRGPANESTQAFAAPSVTTPPAHGTAAVNSTTGSITYTPTPGFAGADSFVYEGCDNGRTNGAADPKCDRATVAVTVVSVEDDLEELVDANPGTPLSDKLDDALAKLAAADAKLAKTPPDRQGALGEYESAVGEIEAAVKDGLVPAPDGRAFMLRVCGTARKVATDAIAEAVARGGNQSKLAEAARAVAEGDARRDAGRFKDAVARYKDAVSKAEGA
jgi:hypothetical protein